jgi:mono/diheme cytochrome c family protein
MRRFRYLLPFIAAAVVAGCSRGSGSSTSGAPPAPALPPGVTTAMIAQGDSLFNNTNPQPTPCARCHGPQGAGGQNGPSLTTGPWLQITGTVDDIAGVITTGVPRDKIKDPAHRNPMGARGGPMRLTDPQIRAIASYIWSISRAKTSAD